MNNNRLDLGEFCIANTKDLSSKSKDSSFSDLLKFLANGFSLEQEPSCTHSIS